MAKSAEALKKRVAPLEQSLRVKGTSPLSFEVYPGDTLTIREFEPSSHNRPTVSGGFKTSAYLLFNGITKVGRLNPKDVSELDPQDIPEVCTVVEVDKIRKILKISLKNENSCAKR